MKANIQSLLLQLTSRYNALQVRDQRALLVMVCSLTILSVYLFIWKPVNDWSVRQEQDYSQQLKDYQWIQSNAPASTVTEDVKSEPAQPVTTLVGAAARDSGVRISRVQPNKSGLSVWVDESPYQNFLKWLVILETTHGLQLSQVRISQQQQPGLVQGYLQITD